jgi:hypothetical protein
MASVVGIDLSTRAIDLVRLEEDTNRADWTRCQPTGDNAWARTLQIPTVFADGLNSVGYWDDVYLVAIEAPYGRGQAGTNALLNRVVGAIVACLPSELRAPERCWIVRPDEWKNGLGLKGKPSFFDIEQLSHGTAPVFAHDDDQNARDAYALAFWARTENARGVPVGAGGEAAG